MQNLITEMQVLLRLSDVRMLGLFSSQKKGKEGRVASEICLNQRHLCVIAASDC